MSLILRSFLRSSTSVQVPISLNLKGFAHEDLSYILRIGGTETLAYLALNPQGKRPTPATPATP